MAKKKVDADDIPDEGTPVAVAIIEPISDKLTEFKISNVEESIAIIAEQRKANELLVIDGTEDKVGYEAVKLAMSRMKNDRIAFVDAATENVIDPATKALKKFKEDLAKIADEFKAAEQDLRNKKDFIDNEKVRIKAEAEAEKVRVMQVRVNDLNVLGAIFDGKLYTFPYTEVLMITATDVKDLTAEKFKEFVDQVKLTFDADQERINNEIAEAALEAERVRLQTIANETAAVALKLRITKLRTKELTMLGYHHDEVDDEWVNPSIPIPVSLKVIDQANDDGWDHLICVIERYGGPGGKSWVVEEVIPIMPDEPVIETQEPTFVDGLGTDDYIPDGGDFESGGILESHTIPMSTQFWESDVVDFGEEITNWKILKDYSIETIIDKVREETPHGECGHESYTMLVTFEGKFFEATVTNIAWGRHDKQYYFIDMYEPANLYIREVIPQPGQRPVFNVSVNMEFEQEMPYTDSDISPKMIMRVFPDGYEGQALAGVEAIANRGKFQELNWVIIKKPGQ